MAKILVTGATGFIGKRLIIRLLKENHEIYALSRIKGIDLKFPDLSPSTLKIRGNQNLLRLRSGIANPPLEGRWKGGLQWYLRGDR